MEYRCEDLRRYGVVLLPPPSPEYGTLLALQLLAPDLGVPPIVFELRAAPSDLSKIIGKQGRTADSIRTILDVAGKKLHRRFRLEILE